MSLDFIHFFLFVEATHSIHIIVYSLTYGVNYLFLNSCDQYPVQKSVGNVGYTGLASIINYRQPPFSPSWQTKGHLPNWSMFNIEQTNGSFSHIITHDGRVAFVISVNILTNIGITTNLRHMKKL